MSFMEMYESLKSACDELERQNKKNLKKEFEYMLFLYEAQYNLFKRITLILRREIFINDDDFTSFNRTIIRRNMFNLYSIYKLTIQGLIGPARILMRNTFESLIIAKYISVSKDEQLIKKWENSEQIILGKCVYDKLNDFRSNEYQELWSILCKFTHSSNLSQQVYLAGEKEMKVNIDILLTLLEMNYHLINNYYINEPIEFYINKYKEEDEDEKRLKEDINKIRNLLNKVLADNKEHMKEICIVVIEDYCKSWELKKTT